MPSWAMILLPQAILIVAACIIAAGMRLMDLDRTWKAIGMLAVIGAAFALLGVAEESSLPASNPALSAPQLSSESQPDPATHAPVLQDSLSISLQWICLAVGTILVLSGLQSPPHAIDTDWLPRALLSMAGAMLTCVAADLLLLFVVLELTVLPWAVQQEQVETSSGNAAPDRLYLNLTASLFLLLGFAALYGLTGSSHVDAVRAALESGSLPNSTRPAGVSEMGVVAMVFIVAGLAVRLGVAPFHFGLPEVFENASTPAALLVWPRIAAFVVLLRVPCEAMASLGATGQWLVWVLSMSSMIVGGARAVAETNIRRRLAYATLAQGGIVLAGITVGYWELAHGSYGIDLGRDLPGGMKSGLACFVCHLFAIAGLVAVLSYLQKPGRSVDHLDDLKGVFRSEPLAGLCALVLLLSLAGAPPLPGFWSNLLVLGGTLSVPAEFAGELLPAPAPGFALLGIVVGVTMLLISMAYVGMVASLFLEGQIARPGRAGGRAALVAALLAALFIAGAGLLPGPLLRQLEEIELSEAEGGTNAGAGKMETTGLEPATSAVQGRRSPN